MEIKATLNKPYTTIQRADFIVEYNHRLGYEIKEAETELQAWGRTEEEQIEFELENKKKQVKAIRDTMINNISWRVERAKEQSELGIQPVDDYTKLLEYRQYLRDYPNTVENWWESNPESFEDWVIYIYRGFYNG